MPLVLLLFALFASLFSLSKIGLEYASPFFLVGSRMLLSGLLLLLFRLVTSREALRHGATKLIPITAMGLCAIYLCNTAEIWGLTQMFSSRACLLYSLSPFVAAFLAYLVLGEVLSLRKWGGMILGFLGVVPIVMDASSCSMESALGGVLSLGDLAIFVAVLTSSYGWIMLKKLVTHHKVDPIVANGYAMSIGGGLALMHSYISGEPWAPLPVSKFWPFLQNIVLVGFISNVICYNLYGHLLKRFSASFMAYAGLVTPLFASLFGWFLLDEEISLSFWISVMIFAAGLWLFNDKEGSEAA